MPWLSAKVPAFFAGRFSVGSCVSHQWSVATLPHADRGRVPEWGKISEEDVSNLASPIVGKNVSVIQVMRVLRHPARPGSARGPRTAF
jgi:hypothetical protein